MSKSLIISTKSWNEKIIKDYIKLNPNFKYFNHIKKLKEYLKKNKPNKIFFIHFSQKVPLQITAKFECINFHMTDLPFGRGGSPLQNLIIRGFKKTILTAHTMTNKIDEGDIILKRSMSLKGSAKSIYIRSTKLSLRMIKYISKNRIKSKKQIGKAVQFKRRNKDQSKLKLNNSLEYIYNFIRMLDAPGYPHAFINTKTKKVIFKNAKYNNKILTAKIQIINNE